MRRVHAILMVGLVLLVSVGLVLVSCVIIFDREEIIENDSEIESSELSAYDKEKIEKLRATRKIVFRDTGTVIMRKTITDYGETEETITDTVVKTITDQDEIDEVVDIITRVIGKVVGQNFFMIGPDWHLDMYDADGELIDPVMFWESERIQMNGGKVYILASGDDRALLEIIKRQ